MKKFLLSLLIALSAFTGKAQNDDTSDELRAKYLEAMRNDYSMALRIDTFYITDKTLVQARERQMGQPQNRAGELMERIEQKVQDAVTAAASAANRFEVTDMERAYQIDKELSETLAMNLSNDELKKIRKNMAQKTLAADWKLGGIVTSCQFDKKGNYGYSCILYITTMVRDRKAENEPIVDSRQFVSDIKKIAVMKSREDAVDKALLTMSGDFVKYFKGNFPVYAKVLRLTDKNDAEISCGAQNDVKKGDVFQVEKVEYNTMGGKNYETITVIGTLKVDDVLHNTAICSLNSGKKEIIEANANGDLLKCKMIMK